MLRFVTKKELWDIEDSGILKKFKQHSLWHLKTIQDAVTWSVIHDAKGQTIGEVGGGDSRLLRPLAKSNTCYNVDKFAGLDGGPAKEIVIPGVKNVVSFIGATEGLIAPETFDILFSVSVMEHVPTANLPDFFSDCHRILKPGGKMLHLIDLYVADEDENNQPSRERVGAYRAAFETGEFTPMNPADPIIDTSDVKFSCAYTSNPDNAMQVWNKAAPKLRSRREICQSCTLILKARRV